ncbi:hypothetical protein K438DRAFT_1909106 [Mycena galopus ATCC 62051]|nr:hypothetical protein K438DRAFT_1909106 [Mycena galopus ATCC 62051]
MTDHTAPRRRLSNVKFRVLVAGRANAGKTSILQRVCDTTESPKVYRLIGNDRKEIHLHPTSERGEHNISDELEFSNHKGYVFHDSCGLESGVASELQTLQTFVRERSGRKRLQDRVHAIWYCIPMDDDRPSLNIAPLRNIHVDENVPVIAVFTKFETFRLLTKNNMIHNGQKGSLPDECEKRFTERYLSELGKGRKVVRLERMHKPGARCDELVETTMKSLDPATVMLMLLAVQTQNLALNVKHLVSR